VFIYAPKNAGLKLTREKGLELLGALNYVEERGEDIPRKVIDSIEPAVGITGLDLLTNELLVRENEPNFGITYLDLAYQGSYEKSIFGLPTLCLIQRGDFIESNQRINQVGFLDTLELTIQGFI